MPVALGLVVVLVTSEVHKAAWEPQRQRSWRWHLTFGIFGPAHLCLRVALGGCAGRGAPQQKAGKSQHGTSKSAPKLQAHSKPTNTRTRIGMGISTRAGHPSAIQAHVDAQPQANGSPEYNTSSTTLPAVPCFPAYSFLPKAETFFISGRMPVVSPSSHVCNRTQLRHVAGVLDHAAFFKPKLLSGGPRGKHTRERKCTWSTTTTTNSTSTHRHANRSGE